MTPVIEYPGLIVTADDFGRGSPVNGAIRRAFAEGLVSHASILANMPGFEEACTLAHEHAFAGRIGLHLNLTAGVPLTDGMKRVAAFCKDGEFFLPGRLGRLKPLSAAEAGAVADEARAQIRAVRAQGLVISHLDSHNDMHIEPSIARLVLSIARDAGIVRVRPARNCGDSRGFVRRVQHDAYNAWLTRSGFRRVRYFGTIDDFWWLASRNRFPDDTTMEIMTHPVPGPGDVVVDAPSVVPLTDRLPLRQGARRELANAS